MKKHVLSHMRQMLSPSSYDRPLLRMGWLRLLVWLISSAMLSEFSLAVESSVTIRYVDQLPAEPGSAWDGVDGAAYVGTLGEGKGYSTIKAAIAAMSSGDHIILRGGTYVEGYIVLPSSKDGTSWDEGCYNRVASYPGEWAVLDGENNLPNTNGNVAVMGNIISCAYWKFERLEICNGRRADGDRARMPLD